MLAEHDLATAQAEMSVAREVDRAQHATVLEAVKGRTIDVRRSAGGAGQLEAYPTPAQVEPGRENGHGAAE
jgi:hypothetical protein